MQPHELQCGSPLAPPPQLSMSDDPAGNSKQVLKCVAFFSKQVGDMLRRRRGRLAHRLQAVTDETELQDDLEQAQALGYGELLKDLADADAQCSCATTTFLTSWTTTMSRWRSTTTTNRSCGWRSRTRSAQLKTKRTRSTSSRA
ncbi:hypothetical protein PF004_g11813 [Phytophthora fragariae]|uniref:Uncharacterized protein n=1 Tax=Phytophthora fragariae TaxID=53985 RepID=A0A6G0NWX9_9STRA|nr:hypothetical protein PF004_g11813 [Phytophthora fragariae]